MTRLCRRTVFGILKLSSVLIGVLLGIFFGCSCGNGPLEYGPMPVEYGMPYADFKVIGTVRSADSSLPVKGLSVSLRDSMNASRIIDSARTDSLGRYLLEFSGFAFGNIWTLSVKDMDSSANGSFAEKDTVISQPPLQGGDGHWYEGHGEETVDVNVTRSN